MAEKIKDFNEYSDKTHVGVELFNNKKYKDALKVFLELSQYNTSNYKVFETLALIYIKLNNIAKAEQSYKKALELFSQKTGGRFKIQSFEEAVSQLETIDELKTMYEKECEKNNDQQENPEKSDNTLHRLPLMMGMRYMAQGEFKKAEELLIQHRNKYFQRK